MSILLDALQPHLLRGLLSVRGAATMTLDELLRRSGCYPSYDAARATWVLDFQDAALVAQVQAHECSRMACAALQSHSNVAEDLADGNRVPWALVCAYYAAYYAANCVGRAFGTSCSFLDRDRANLIGSILDVYAIQSKPDRGLYFVCATASGAGLEFAKAGAGLGGSHDAFWKIFGAKLKALEDSVMQGGLRHSEAQAVFLKLAEFREVVCQQSRPFNWLSEMRNGIQYRHSLDAWFPAKPRAKARRKLSLLALQASADPMEIQLDAGDEVGRFMSASAFLVSVCRGLMGRIAQCCAVGASFVEAGPLKYIRQRAG